MWLDMATACVAFAACGRSQLYSGPVDGGSTQVASSTDRADAAEMRQTLRPNKRDDAVDSGPPRTPNVKGLPFVKIAINHAGLSTCGIRTNGSLYCWGLACGEDEQGSQACWGRTCLGDQGCRTLGPERFTPGYEVSAPPKGRFVDVVPMVLFEEACALDANGTPTCWGYTDRDGPLWGTGLEFVQIEGGSGSCGIRNGGSLWCNSLSNYPTGDALSKTYTSIAASAYHFCALRTDGELECWGIAEGHDDIVGLSKNVDPPAGPFTQIAVGSFHSCALRRDGTAVCWGAGTTLGVCGVEMLAPLSYECGQAMPPPGAFTQLALGNLHSCGLRPDGSVECWGVGTRASPCEPGFGSGGNPNCGQAMPPAGRFLAVAAGRYHSCALDDAGEVTCWGLGSVLGECGGLHYSSELGFDCGQAGPPY